jgi:hypothetical protein
MQPYSGAYPDQYVVHSGPLNAGCVFWWVAAYVLVSFRCGIVVNGKYRAQESFFFFFFFLQPSPLFYWLSEYQYFQQSAEFCAVCWRVINLHAVIFRSHRTQVSSCSGIVVLSWYSRRTWVDDERPMRSGQARSSSLAFPPPSVAGIFKRPSDTPVHGIILWPLGQVN